MKKVLALMIVLVMLFSLCACGAGKYAAADEVMTTESKSENGYSIPQDAMKEEMAEEEAAEYEFDSEQLVDSVSNSITETGTGINAEKIIYSASAEIETVEFDKTVEDVYAMIEEIGGFLESSSVSGTDYYTYARGGQSYRSASFTIRVPVGVFKEVTGNLSDLGNVTYCNVWSDNITAMFFDTQSRLDMYKLEEERLLVMLEKAETVEDMIAIEERLSNVRYEIESLTSTLKNWQNEVDYSTLMLNICEVERLTEKVETTQTYWERVGSEFMITLKNVGSFFKDLLRVVIAGLPVIILVAAVIVVIVLLIVKIVKPRKTKRAPKNQDEIK